MAKVHMSPYPSRADRDNDPAFTINGLKEGQSPPPATAPPVTQSPPAPPTLASEAFKVLTTIAAAYNADRDRAHRDFINPMTGQIDSESIGFKQRQAEFASGPAASEIATVERLIAADIEAKRHASEQVRKSLVTEGDTASEIRASRKWDSAKALLDSRDASLSAGRKLLESASNAELSVLLEQLPAYYQAKGVDPKPVIDAVLAQKVPELASANADLRDAERKAAVITADAARLRAGISSGTRFRVEGLVDPQVVVR